MPIWLFQAAVLILLVVIAVFLNDIRHAIDGLGERDDPNTRIDQEIAWVEKGASRTPNPPLK